LTTRKPHGGKRAAATSNIGEVVPTAGQVKRDFATGDVPRGILNKLPTMMRK